MDEKIKNFRDIYYEDFEKIEKNGDFYTLINTKNELQVYPFKIINFIKEDDFIKNLNSFFIIKRKTYGGVFNYIIYFKDSTVGEVNITIKNVNEFIINTMKDRKYNVKNEKFREIAKKITEHLINNTNERIKFMLNGGLY